ncbi:hypothetical protein Droror1_Dr00010869 [Drosera rotundifolia]
MFEDRGAWASRSWNPVLLTLVRNSEDLACFEGARCAEFLRTRIVLSGSYGLDFELEGTTGTKRAKLRRLGVSVAAAWSVLFVRLRARNSLNGTIKRTKHGTPIVGTEMTGSLLVETLKSCRAQGTGSVEQVELSLEVVILFQRRGATGSLP